MHVYVHIYMSAHTHHCLIFTYYFYLNPTLLTEICTGVAVDSHAVTRNNTERLLVRFALFPQMAPFCKTVTSYPGH